MNQEFDSVNPPTKEEFEAYNGNLYMQILDTGWLGYGERAVYFQEADVREINDCIAYFERRERGVNSHGLGMELEELVYSNMLEHPELHNVRRNVKCTSGIADIVSDEEIVECKTNPNREQVFQAIGQVLMYRADINPNALAIVAIATKRSEWKAIQALAPTAASLGVVIVFYEIVERQGKKPNKKRGK